ncbi:MAG: hypothetical protein JWR37_5317 [Mycobacterium sp.]|jgi:hypothetical protein|nr:hypothetical protein [Mycobacterium sp.]
MKNGEGELVGQTNDNDGSMADLPWAAVFDPAGNVRALGEIQARGFRAATELVDRFVRLADRDRAAASDSAAPKSASPPTGDETASATTFPNVDQVLGSWQRLLGQLTQSFSGTAPTTGPGAATFDLVNDNASGQISFEAAEPGAVSTEVWLHNGGPTDMGKVRMRCSDLLAHDGTVIPAQSVRFEPDTVSMPARCSRGVTVEVDVADDLAPGCYRGTLLADGHPDVWLPITLAVKPQLA